MAKANVTIIEAQMGEGKTNSATAIVVDEYFNHIRTIVSPEGHEFPVEPYKLDQVKLIPLKASLKCPNNNNVYCLDYPEYNIKSLLSLARDRGYQEFTKAIEIRALSRESSYDFITTEEEISQAVLKTKQTRLVAPKIPVEWQSKGSPSFPTAYLQIELNKREGVKCKLDCSRCGKAEQPKIITVPKGFTTISDTKIFANYHLFGMQYVLCDPITMMEHLNSNLVSHGKMIIDEAYITGEARRGMNTLSLIYTWFAQQMRKRDIELYLLVQHGRFIDWRFRYIAKRKILCRYNEKTHMIKLLIQNLGKGTEKLMSFYAPQYWKFFDTNELPTVPEKMLAKGKAYG